MMMTLVGDHAPVILFLWVLGNQAGVPLPVVPAILAVGALARGPDDFAAILTVVVGAAVCADLVWYTVGRWRGRRVLTWFGRFRSARRAMDRMAKLSPVRRALVLVGARFLPGVNPMAAGLAGVSRATLGRYLLYGIGTAAVWASTWAGIGYVLGAVIAHGDSSMMCLQHHPRRRAASAHRLEEVARASRAESRAPLACPAAHETGVTAATAGLPAVHRRP